MQNVKIIHLIHCDGPGGVETGAKLAKKEFKGSINYEIRFIYNAGDNILVKLKKFLKVIKSLFKEIRVKKNHIILSSLWMSHIISFILKVLLKKMLWISFIHNSNYTNIISYLICTKLTRLADKQVFDSYSTARAYSNNSINHNRIINYFFQKYDLKEFDIKDWSNRKYDFITVARNTKQKGFLELEKFCINVSKLYPSRLKFLIITDDIEKILDLKVLKEKLNSICDIQFEVNLTNTDVLKRMTDSKVYFCLSHYEGFGITIVESLLSGCFIVTTNVGEQKNYLHPSRRLILNDNSNYNLDINYINHNGPLTENFSEAKEFLYKNVKSYSDSLKLIVMENK